MSILNVNKINPVGGGSTITIAGIASVTNNLTATNISAGSSVTANAFYGSGANLTGISAGTSLSGSTNNTVCTVTGANAIKGEANLTFNGGETGDAQLTVHAAEANANSDSELILETSNDFATSAIMFKDSTAEAGSVAYNHGDNYIKFSTFGTDGGTERMRISKEGYVTNPARPCFDVAKDDGHVSSTNAIVFNVVNVNNGSHYNTSNGRFTAPVTGTYFLYFGGIKANSSGVVRLKLLKNGTGNYMNSDRELRYDTGGNYGENASMNVIVSLTATDYVQVYVTAGTIYGTDPSYTHFGGYLLS